MQKHSGFLVREAGFEGVLCKPTILRSTGKDGVGFGSYRPVFGATFLLNLCREFVGENVLNLKNVAEANKTSSIRLNPERMLLLDI